MKTSKKPKAKPRATAHRAKAAPRKAVKKVVAARKPAAHHVAKPAARPAAHKPAKPAGRHVATAKPQPAVKRPAGGGLTEDRLRSMSDGQYMNEAQMEFFRRRLLQMRQEVVDREVDVKERLHQREVFADPADRATAEEEHWLDLRLRERESLLLRKIDDALRRIAEKEYGYCEVTGEPIGIPRLLARPTATVCVDVKDQNEQIEAQFRDR